MLRRFGFLAALCALAWVVGCSDGGTAGDPSKTHMGGGIGDGELGSSDRGAAGALMSARGATSRS